MMSDTFDQTYADFSAARRAQIVARIEAACARAGRDVSEVSPVAVSKTVGTGELLAAWRAGWRRFAENRPQELTRKLAFVEQTPEMAGAAFDLIGNLQKNKINDAADLVAKNVDPEANIIFGTVVDESLGDQVRVTVIATGFNDSNVQQTLPSMTMPVARPAAPARPVAPQPAPAPINVSRPQASSSNNDKEFDIPDFLKRSRI